jgi:hypothetical protein
VKKIKFNLNDYITVKLGYEGRLIWIHQSDNLFRNNQYKQKFESQEQHRNQIDENGYLRSQAHSIFNVFGEYMHMGFGCDLFDLTIEIEVDE